MYMHIYNNYIFIVPIVHYHIVINVKWGPSIIYQVALSPGMPKDKVILVMTIFKTCLALFLE